MLVYMYIYNNIPQLSILLLSQLSHRVGFFNTKTIWVISNRLWIRLFPSLVLELGAMLLEDTCVFLIFQMSLLLNESIRNLNFKLASMVWHPLSDRAKVDRGKNSSMIMEKAQVIVCTYYHIQSITLTCQHLNINYHIHI
jgi:hypothetical protein